MVHKLPARGTDPEVHTREEPRYTRRPDRCTGPHRRRHWGGSNRHHLAAAYTDRTARRRYGTHHTTVGPCCRTHCTRRCCPARVCCSIACASCSAPAQPWRTSYSCAFSWPQSDRRGRQASVQPGVATPSGARARRKGPPQRYRNGSRPRNRLPGSRVDNKVASSNSTPGWRDRIRKVRWVGPLVPVASCQTYGSSSATSSRHTARPAPLPHSRSRPQMPPPRSPAPHRTPVPARSAGRRRA